MLMLLTDSLFSSVIGIFVLINNIRLLRASDVLSALTVVGIYLLWVSGWRGCCETECRAVLLAEEITEIMLYWLKHFTFSMFSALPSQKMLAAKLYCQFCKAAPKQLMFKMYEFTCKAKFNI